MVLRNNTGVNFQGIGSNSYQQTTHFEIVNNIFYGSPSGGWTVLSCMSGPGVTYDIRYNCWMRGAPTPSCPLGVGNLLATDPRFCDENDDDYRLQPDSPCIGSGEGGTSMGAFGVGCGVTGAGDPVASPPLGLRLDVVPNPVVPGGVLRLGGDPKPPIVVRAWDAAGRLVTERAFDSPGGLEIPLDEIIRGIWREGRASTSGVIFFEVEGADGRRAVTKALVVW